jgi:hypothetical protein
MWGREFLAGNPFLSSSSSSEVMEDAAGQLIHRLDLVKFKTACAHGDRRMVLNSLSLLDSKRLIMLCADGTEVVVKPCNVSIVDQSVLSCPCFPVKRESDPKRQRGQ